MQMNVKVKIVSVSFRKCKTGKSVMYFHPTGETVFDNLLNRRARPYEEYRKQIPAVLELIKAGTIIEYDDKMPDWFKSELQNATFNWSQKAGCSCPCSPGFVIKGYSHYHFNVFVNYTLVQEQAGA